MGKADTLKIQIQQTRELISWQKEVNRIAKVEIRMREAKIKKLQKRLKQLSAKNKK